MPVYLVRWPNLSVSLVQAADEEDLASILDEIGDPSYCIFKIYDAPFLVDLTLRFDLDEDDQLIERGTRAPVDAPVNLDDATFTIDVPGVGSSPLEPELFRTAFPSLGACMAATDGEDVDTPRVKESLRADLQFVCDRDRWSALGWTSLSTALAEYHVRHAEDFDGELAAALGNDPTLREAVDEVTGELEQLIEHIEAVKARLGDEPAARASLQDLAACVCVGAARFAAGFDEDVETIVDEIDANLHDPDAARPWLDALAAEITKCIQRLRRVQSDT